MLLYYGYTIEHLQVDQGCVPILPLLIYDALIETQLIYRRYFYRGRQQKVMRIMPECIESFSDKDDGQ